MTTAADVVVRSGGEARTVVLDELLGPDEIEECERTANAWIKSLRHVTVDGVPFRDRFTVRGDSLWWFAELYLHKERVVVRVLRSIAAFERLAREAPGAAWLVAGRDPVVRHVAALVAGRHRVAWEPEGTAEPLRPRQRLRAAAFTASALADRLRRRGPSLPNRATVAAFLHAAFFDSATGDETYTGPVLRELKGHLPDDGLQIVGLGPRTSFRVRSMRDRLRELREPEPAGLPFTPVEAFAGWRSLAESRRVWRERHAMLAALQKSDELRAAAHFQGYDVWPVLAPEFEGIVLLQFPWSARAMDEAAAALDRLKPSVAFTYAEAGGWGRALVLEARRRGIPIVALQHGFIYRHWLNYLHEPDEMQPSPVNPADRGFPAPTRTLVFDRFTAEHLTRDGRFTPSSLTVVGSPRLDALRAASGGDAGRERTRSRVGVQPGSGWDRLVVVASKYLQIASVYPDLLRAVAALPRARLVIKPHPAEGPDPYVRAAAGIAEVLVAGRDLALAELLTAADLLVTVNSTAAIEAIAFDVPALVVALPNNLSPLVDAGALAGAPDRRRIGELVEALLYDREMRERLAEARRAFAAAYGIAADGQAARRAAEAVLTFVSAPAGRAAASGQLR